MATKLEALLEAGELHRAARGVLTQADLARAVGLTPKAFKEGKKRILAAGRPFPTLAELRGEQAAAPPPAQRWPNVEAFDAEIPLPAVPSGHFVKGASTLVGPDGEIRAQWVKTTAQSDERADWLAAIRDMGGDMPRAAPTQPAADSAADSLVVLPVGDPHVGLLSWREDAGGENFDLEIAEDRYVRAFSHLIGLAPPAAECLLVFIGDTAHADGQSNTTTKGTRVDVDGRIIKVARTILRICRHAIGLSLARFGRVSVIIERGNHDELISAMIALALAQHYEHEPRVYVDQSPAVYHWHRFGRVLIGTHHGDKAKPMDLLGVMAVDQAEIWGACPHRRFYLGHYHHQIVKEVPGLICEYLPTLATSDAWHHSMGYRSQRALYLDVYHREHGHVNRHIVGMSQLGAA